MNIVVAVLGFGYGVKGNLGSQTETALKQGVSIWKFFVGYKTSPTLVCSGMAIIPHSDPPVTQEDLMKEYVEGEKASCLVAEKTQENLVLYNKTWGNAIELLDMAIRNKWGDADVYLVDHPIHLPRMKMALWWVSCLAHYKGLHIVGNPTEVDASNQAQWVAKTSIRFWFYEKAISLFQVVWLLIHGSQIRKHFEDMYRGAA